MFILYFLGVGPPCRSIFCQFWFCEEAQCVYLRRRLGSCPVGMLMGGIYPQVSQLQGLASTTTESTDHHGGSAVQGRTTQSRTYLSMALVPAEYAP